MSQVFEIQLDGVSHFIKFSGLEALKKAVNQALYECQLIEHLKSEAIDIINEQTRAFNADVKSRNLNHFTEFEYYAGFRMSAAAVNEANLILKTGFLVYSDMDTDPKFAIIKPNQKVEIFSPDGGDVTYGTKGPVTNIASFTFNGKDNYRVI